MRFLYYPYRNLFRRWRWRLMLGNEWTRWRWLIEWARFFYFLRGWTSFTLSSSLTRVNLLLAWTSCSWASTILCLVVEKSSIKGSFFETFSAKASINTLSNPKCKFKFDSVVTLRYHQLVDKVCVLFNQFDVATLFVGKLIYVEHPIPLLCIKLTRRQTIYKQQWK